MTNQSFNSSLGTSPPAGWLQADHKSVLWPREIWRQTQAKGILKRTAGYNSDTRPQWYQSLAQSEPASLAFPSTPMRLKKITSA